VTPPWRAASLGSPLRNACACAWLHRTAQYGTQAGAQDRTREDFGSRFSQSLEREGGFLDRGPVSSL
jgi:hypothetical protein